MGGAVGRVSQGGGQHYQHRRRRGRAHRKHRGRGEQEVSHLKLHLYLSNYLCPNLSLSLNLSISQISHYVSLLSHFLSLSLSKPQDAFVLVKEKCVRPGEKSIASLWCCPIL